MAISVTITDTANPQDEADASVIGVPSNTLSPDITASQRTRHLQQRHARAAAGYRGQETINTVGTVTAGEWRGEPIDSRYLQILTVVTCMQIGALGFPANVYNNGDGGVGATLTFSAAGAVTIDGHTLALNDTVCINAQGGSLSAAAAGVYLVTTVPSSTQAGVLTRHPAFQYGWQFVGAMLIVATGTANAQTSWLQGTPAPIIVGTTGVGWNQVTAAFEYGGTLTTMVAGTGISLSASPNAATAVAIGQTITVGINPTWPGQTAITTLGTITTGTWHGTPIANAFLANSAVTINSGTGLIGGGTLALGSALTLSLANNSVTINAGTGLTGGGSVALGSAITLNLTTPVSITNGGTGQSSATAAFTALSPLTTLGDILYDNGANPVRLAGNTTSTRKFLRQTGTGSVSAAPAWDTVTKTDVGLSSVENTALSTWAGSTNLTTLGTITAGTWNAGAVTSSGMVLFTANSGTSGGVRAEGTIDKTTGAAAFNTLPTTSDTTLYSVTVKGNSLGTTGAARVTVGGDFLCNSGTPTWRFSIQFGTTILWADVTASFGTQLATRGAWHLSFLIANAGATNSQVVIGKLSLSYRGAPLTGEGPLTPNTATTPFYEAPLYGTAAEDSTADRALAVLVRPSVNNASVEITRKLAITEIMP